MFNSKIFVSNLCLQHEKGMDTMKEFLEESEAQ